MCKVMDNNFLFFMGNHTILLYFKSSIAQIKIIKFSFFRRGANLRFNGQDSKIVVLNFHSIISSTCFLEMLKKGWKLQNGYITFSTH